MADMMRINRTAMAMLPARVKKIAHESLNLLPLPPLSFCTLPPPLRRSTAWMRAVTIIAMADAVVVTYTKHPRRQSECHAHGGVDPIIMMMLMLTMMPNIKRFGLCNSHLPNEDVPKGQSLTR